MEGWIREDPAGATQWLQASDMPINDLARCVSGGTLQLLYGPGLTDAAKWPADQLSQKFEKWAAANPQSTIEWLTNAPDSVRLKPALEGALRTLEKTDPDQATQLRSRLKP